MKPRATQADVARAAGVSATTVSLVLNGRKNTRISPEARTRVREAAEALGYSPDPTARSLRTGRSKAVAFISDGVTITRFASAMISGVMAAAEERGQMVLMAEWDNDPAKLESSVRAMTERRVDAVVFGLMMARRIELPPLPSTLPAVIVNGEAEGLPSVLPAERQAGRDAVEHLLALGHRRIAVIGRWNQPLVPSISVAIGERFEGMDAALADAGLRFAEEFPGAAWEPPLGRDAGRRLFERPDSEDRPTAVLCANDRIAFGLYQAAAETGTRIPEDVSVLSFDNEELATYLHPALSTLRLPYREMGETGADLALHAAGTGALGPEHSVRLPMALLDRDSTAAPRG